MSYQLIIYDQVKYEIIYFRLLCLTEEKQIY